MNTKLSTKDEIESRSKMVSEMNANNVMSGFYPDESDKLIQEKYIQGEVPLSALLEHAIAFAKLNKGTNTD